MNVSEAIAQRRSVRSYQPVEVEEEKLCAVLEAARLAPSAKNRQEWKFIVVRDPEVRRKLAAAAKGQAFVAEAPIVLVACATGGKYLMSCGQDAASVDTSIAFSFMVLQAVELGLATCWLGAFHEDEVQKVLGIPKEVRVVAMTPLGYPAAKSPPRPRKPLGEIVCSERYR